MGEIVTVPAPVLRAVAADCELDVAERLCDRLIDVARRCERPAAVGLAAPQVGVSLRAFVWRESAETKDWFAAINPRIVERHGKQSATEGCLSSPGRWHAKRRALAVVMLATNPWNGEPERWEVEGFEARILQHEADHLDGRLFFDPTPR